ncbi:MAG: flagellar biosynthetic protein FliR [Planctomycetota bacterium]|jgi:flagellar biosynthetic protein FliR
MPETPHEVILAHVPPALLVLFRLGGLAIYAPVFGARVVPGRVKVLLMVMITVAVYPVLDAEVFAAAPLELSLWSLLPIVGLELAIGLLIGYLASLPLIAIQTGGLVMGQQMGLGFARFFNPAADTEADVIGQMLFFMTLAGFLVIGGHEAIVLAVLHSFEHIPLGGFVPDGDLLVFINGLLTSALELAIRVAAPLLALIFLESVAMGFIAKTVPQLNVLSLGFPLRILAGLLIIFLGLQVIDTVVMEATGDVMDAIFRWIES